MSHSWYKPYIFLGMLRINRDAILTAEKALGHAFTWDDLAAALSELPSSVSSLCLNNLALDNFPPLPANIKGIYVENCHMADFKTPEHLENLAIQNSTLTSLTLNEGLTFLGFLKCSFTDFVLPKSLLTYSQNHSPIKTLPVLPEGLLSLSVDNTDLKELPPLPPRLEQLHCGNNPWLKTIPPLPATIKEIHAMNNSFESFQTIPDGCVKILLNNNLLTAFPSIPESVKEICLIGNPVLKTMTFEAPWKSNGHFGYVR
uniref:Leucine-rich repeat protein n=1 Tax=viral metagenome TaxID=1070528 RepID=A0A6C0DHM0_9ZZZZ